MLARCKRRLACRTEGGSQNRYSLKFVNRGLEAGFAKNNAKQLVGNLRICSLATALTSGIFLVLAEPWDMSGKRFSSPREQKIMNAANIVFAVAVSYAIVVFAVCCLPCTSQTVPLLRMEIIAIFIVCSGMVLFVLSLPYQVGCTLGYDDPAVYLAGKHVTDTKLLMSIETILTATHLVLPIRFCVIWQVELVGVLCYMSFALVFGTAEPENSSQHLAVLVCLAAMAGVGKRNQEMSDRAKFLSLIEEKSSRCQAEFQLAKIQEEQEVRTVPGPASAKSPSESGLESAPSTTESARKMMPPFSDAGGADQIDADFICEITAIGEKEQWLIQPSEMSVLPGMVLGEGGFGLVLGGLYQGVSVAIKVPKIRNHSIASRSHFASLCNELRVLRRLRHPNIVFLYGACLDQNGYHLALVLELVQGIPLDTFILPWRRSPSLDQQQQPEELGRSQVLLDVACALQFLHSRTPQIVHGDLKGSNIFIEHWQASGADARAKLLDFGLSRMVTKHALPMGGTITWMAPEILQGRRTATSTETDVFSFGRLAYFVLSGIKPFSDMDRREVERILKSNKLPPMQWPNGGFLVERYRSIVEECCDVDPRHRPRMSQVHRKSSIWHDQLRGLRVSVLEASKPFDVANWVRRSDEGEPNQPLDINELMTAGAQLHVAGRELRAMCSQSPLPGGRLPVVPEERECGSTPTARPPGSTASLALPQFRCTSLSTVRAMIMEIQMNCNLEIRECDRCCLFHGTLKSLVSVCVELQSRSCSNRGLGPDTVGGQCPGCGMLIRRSPESSSSAELECAFCGHELNISHSC